MDINDNSEVDLAIQRVNLAIAQSDLRATTAKLTKLAKSTKSRMNYTSRNNQAKAFKPNGVVAPSNFKYDIMPSAKSTSFRAGERSTSTPTPKAPMASMAPYKAPKAPSASQISSAHARSGASNVYTPNVAPKAKTPKKTYVAPKPTAAQLEQGRLRGGTVGGTKPVKFAGIKALSPAQKKAIADAKKKAGGR
jgi:hypothetical protein